MSTQKPKKLKMVLESVPSGYLVDAKWLKEQGIAYETFRDYVKRGWLERLTRGVFRRPVPGYSKSNTIDWKICLLSMQRIMAYDVHVGGMTALSLKGYGHYLPLGADAPVWVYGQDIPNWLQKLPLNARLVTRSPSLFADPRLGLTKEDADAHNTLPWDLPLRTSSPERAILETLDELPNHESFHSVDMVFESLTTLRPRMLSMLLKSCKRIKVKRLFFVFADRHDHAWRDRIDPDDFNLGSGDRAMVKGGKLHPRYRIMVPADIVAKEQSDGA